VAKEKKEKETSAVKQNTSGHYVGGGIIRKVSLHLRSALTIMGFSRGVATVTQQSDVVTFNMFSDS